MIGKRIYSDDTGNISLKEGDYGYYPKADIWYCKAPGCKMGNLSNHEVTEHEDGTITVSPSILITDHLGSWHGYLERGVWREV